MSPWAYTDGVTCPDPPSPEKYLRLICKWELHLGLGVLHQRFLGLGQGTVTLFTATQSKHTLHTVRWGRISTGYVVSICLGDTKIGGKVLDMTPFPHTNPYVGEAGFNPQDTQKALTKYDTDEQQSRLQFIPYFAVKKHLISFAHFTKM